MTTRRTSPDGRYEAPAAPDTASPAPRRTVFVVAVDGPAGSGKSSVSRAVATRLGYAYLDTGAAYRALAWLALERGTDPTDADQVTRLLGSSPLDVGTDPRNVTIRVDGVEVTEAIRDPQVSARVSALARVPAVREHLNRFFRRLIEETSRPGIVVEGRDITTVVAPRAPVRILLTAEAGVRAARRGAQLAGGSGDEVARALHRRDAADSRVVDFMTAAEGVTTVDSTHLDFDATVEAVHQLIEQAGAPHGQ